MTQIEMVNRVNQMMYEGLYTFDEIKYDFDDAIDYINTHLNTTFPAMSAMGTSDESEYTYDVPTLVEDVLTNVPTPIIPDKYIREVVINFVVASLFRREGEFGNEYYMAESNYTKGMDRMFRDFFEKIPTEFLDTGTGFIVINENAVEEDDETDDPSFYAFGTE